MPYSVGLQSAATAFLDAGFPTQFTLAVIVSLSIIILLTSAFHKEPLDAPKQLPGVMDLFHVVPFFRKRYDFLTWGFHATGQNVFQFNLLRNKVIVVSGETARQQFFTARGLDLTEGFKILSGAIPMVRGVTSDRQTRRIALIHKRLANVQRNSSLSALIPHLLSDTRRVMETWGSSGSFDPFENVYALLFQLTIRSLTSSSIANSPALVHRLKSLYDTLDTGTTPATVLLPWLPTPAMIKKLWATKEIYGIVCEAIREREEENARRALSGEGGREEDTLQMLLDCGDEKLVVVGFIMGLLIAGARATGTTASWLITYLGGHTEWRNKAAVEVRGLLATYAAQATPNPNPDPSPTSPQTYSPQTPTPLTSLSTALSHIPLEAWESETPILDALIRETTRVAQPHTAMRRNLGPEMYIDGRLIPTGAYVVYPFSDVHLDEGVYEDPWRFDPGRKQVDERGCGGGEGKGKGVPFGYVGWGGGKTTCLGTRLAKIELKLITAMFVLGFDHWVTDGQGEKITEEKKLPVPNWNDILLARPPVGSFMVGFRRTGEGL